MAVKTMGDLFHETLRDIYYAEKQILKSLPGMVKKAQTGELKEALETHRQETEGQVERIEEVFELINKPARGKTCVAMDGILDEAKEHMSEIEDEQVRDAGIVGAAQAVEHYEIARYGTLIAWANTLGNQEAAQLLKQNLDEEKNADRILSEIGEGMVNQQAAA
jgi:ferritin-like metal-binding protein YciE